MVFFAGAYAAGVILFPFLDLRFAPALMLILLFTAFALPADRRKKWRHGALALVFGLALLLTAWEERRLRTDPFLSKGSKPLEMTGVLAADPSERNERVRFLMKEKETGSPIIVRGPAPLALQYGDEVRIRGVLRDPPGARNPGEFSQAEYLQRQGIHHYLDFWEPDQVTLTARGKASWILLLSHRFRRSIHDLFKRTLPYPHWALAEGILLGERGQLPRQVEKAFANTGTLHVLAASGSNVAVFVFIGFLLGGLFRRKASAQALISIPLVIFYALLVGNEPSILRATLMALIWLAGRALAEETDALNSLGISFLSILLVHPGDIRDVGFQLSYLAVLGIVVLSPCVDKALASLPGWLRISLSTSLGAQLALFPVLATYFNLVSVISPLANLLVVPAVSLSLVLSVVSVLGLLVPFLAQAVGFWNWLILSFLLWINDVLSQVPGAFVSSRSPSVFFYVLYYGALVAWVTFARRGGSIRDLWQWTVHLMSLKRIAFTGLIAALLGGLWLGHNRSNLKVVFLDVGQGDCTIFQLPKGKVILIDGGGAASATDVERSRITGERVVVPYLRRQGVQRISLLVLSHPHSDHVGGLVPVLEEMPVGEVWDPGVASRARISPTYEAFLALVHKKRIAYRTMREGTTASLGKEALIEVLWPRSVGTGNSNTEVNNDSLVLRITTGATAFLLPGDVEMESEEALAHSEAEPVHILKAPHHGSRTSSTPSFLGHFRPGLAVISAGQHNPYGHPSPEAVRNLRSAGARVFRTDQDGAVTVERRENTIEAEGFVSGTTTRIPIVKDKGQSANLSQRL